MISALIGRYGLHAWLGLMLLSVVLIGDSLARGVGVETDIRRAFGAAESGTEIDQWLDAQLAESLGETVVLIGHADRTQLRVAVQAGNAFIDSHALLHRLPWAQPPPADALLAHRGYLMALADWPRWQHSGASEVAAAAQRRLYSPTAMASAFGFDADPFGLLGRFASSRWPDSGFELDGETPVVADQDSHWAVLRLTSGSGNLGLEQAARTVAALDDLAVAVQQAVPGARTVDLSISRHTHRAASQSRREMSRIGIASLVAIVLLLGWLFRHPAPFVLTVASIASGTLVGFAAVAWWFGQLHLIAMVFGAALIGIAVDYALHLLVAPGDGAQRRQAVALGVLLGLMTTCVAFAGLLLAPFESLRQVAVFAIFGLAGACATVLCLLPRWLRAGRLQPRAAAVEFAERMLAHGRLSRRWRVIVVVSLLALAGSGLVQLHTRDDLRAMYYASPDLMAQASMVRDVAGGWEASQMLVVQAANEQRLLQSLEHLHAGLIELQSGGALQAFAHVAQSLPSQQRQHAIHARLEALIYRPGQALDQLAASLGAPAAWVQGQRQAFQNSQPLGLKTWQQQMADTPYVDWIEAQDNGWAGLVRVSGVHDVAAVQAWVAEQRAAGVDVRWRDTIASAQQQLADARRGAVRVLMLAGVVVLMLLVWRYGVQQAVVVALPSMLAVLCTLGLCGWFGQPFTVFRLFALLLVIGLSIDYAIFAREAGSHAGPTLLAIGLSAVTTLLSFGLLGLSSTPALAEFGATVVVGVLIGLGSTWLLWQRPATERAAT